MNYYRLSSLLYFWFSIGSNRRKGEPVKAFLSGTLDAVFWMINKILKLAPLGVFAFICTTIITFGASALLPY